MKIICKNMLRTAFSFFCFICVMNVSFAFDDQIDAFEKTGFLCSHEKIDFLYSQALDIKKESEDCLASQLRHIIVEAAEEMSPMRPKLPMTLWGTYVTDDARLSFVKNNDWYDVIFWHQNSFFLVATVKKVDRKKLLAELAQKYTLLFTVSLLHTWNFDIIFKTPDHSTRQ